MFFLTGLWIGKLGTFRRIFTNVSFLANATCIPNCFYRHRDFNWNQNDVNRNLAPDSSIKSNTIKKKKTDVQVSNNIVILSFDKKKKKNGGRFPWAPAVTIFAPFWNTTYIFATNRTFRNSSVIASVSTPHRYRDCLGTSFVIECPLTSPAFLIANPSHLVNRLLNEVSDEIQLWDDTGDFRIQKGTKNRSSMPMSPTNFGAPGNWTRFFGDRPDDLQTRARNDDAAWRSLRLLTWKIENS